jgi:hypothetical protein
MSTKTTHAVIGYVPDEVAKALGSEGHGRALEVRVERGNDREIVRIPAGAIAGVLHGASQGGETGVQVLLKERATVEAVTTHGIAGDLDLKAILDPGLIHRKPPINVIFVAPEFVPRLTADQSKIS